MYGTDTCGSCMRQKELFGEDFTNVNYVNCAFDSGACREASIAQYPTWKYEGMDFIGVQSLENLSRMTGCAV
jgi:hypothetical protein